MENKHYLYTAPNCIRCKIVKSFLKDQNQTWEETDFKENKDDFNAFYRTNRPSIYRNPEGVEFPIYTDGEVIKQGSGEIIAYLLSKNTLSLSVRQSDLLHGWVSGLYPSLCPKDQEDNFLVLTEALAKGGLSVCLRSDGRNPELVQRLIDKNIVKKLEVNFYGNPEIYAIIDSSLGIENHTLKAEDVVKTIEIAKKFSNSEINLQLIPIKEEDNYRYITKEEVSNAAKFIAEACADKQLPIKLSVCKDEELVAMKLDKKLAEPEQQDLFKYRSAARKDMFKIDIKKD